MSKFKVVERVSFPEVEAVEESKLGVHAMSEHNVAQLVRQDGREASLVRQHVHQSTAQHDGVANVERFQP